MFYICQEPPYRFKYKSKYFVYKVHCCKLCLPKIRIERRHVNVSCNYNTILLHLISKKSLNWQFSMVFLYSICGSHRSRFTSLSVHITLGSHRSRFTSSWNLSVGEHRAVSLERSRFKSIMDCYIFIKFRLVISFSPKIPHIFPHVWPLIDSMLYINVLRNK